MESLIIFIVVAIISSIFGKSKNGQKQHEQMPPFNPSAEQTSLEPKRTRSKQARPTIQSFEDFAKEILSEVKEKIEQPKSKQVSTEVVEVQQQMPAPRETMKSRLEERKNVGDRKDIEINERTREIDVVSSIAKPTHKALIQAIVMAEVLGPPKAKQNARKHSS